MGTTCAQPQNHLTELVIIGGSPIHNISTTPTSKTHPPQQAKRTPPNKPTAQRKEPGPHDMDRTLTSTTLSPTNKHVNPTTKLPPTRPQLRQRRPHRTHPPTTLLRRQLPRCQPRPHPMHVGCRELQRIVEAVGFDWAGSTEVAGLGDVGDVFVVFGEHLVGFAGACCLVAPGGVGWLGCVCIVWICLVGLVVRDFLEGVHG